MNYVIYANKQFNNFEFLQSKLDIIFASKKHYIKIYAYNIKEQKNLWSMLTKYCNWNNIELINIDDVYDDFKVMDVLIFENKETSKVRKFIKFIKKMYIRPIIYKENINENYRR